MPHHCCVRAASDRVVSPKGDDQTSMADNETAVIGGVDCHLGTHHAVALDQHGRRLGDHEFRATVGGYGQLLSWLRQFGGLVAFVLKKDSPGLLMTLMLSLFRSAVDRAS